MSAPMQQLDAGPTASGAPLRFRPAPMTHALRRQSVALAQTIEAQIVPRLVVARAPVDAVFGQPGTERGVTSEAVLEMTSLALGDDANAIRRRLIDSAARMPFEALCLELVAPTARQLGEMWEEDLCSFADVTIGMMRLTDGLHAVAAGLREGWRDKSGRHSILLAAAPGDPHIFGVTMVGTFFEQAGWTVGLAHGSTVAELAGLLRKDWFGVLGFSVSSDRHLDALARALPRLRAASRNPALAILVGGPVFAADPALAGQIGADGTAPDGVQATWMAENLLSPLLPARLPHT